MHNYFSSDYIIKQLTFAHFRFDSKIKRFMHSYPNYFPYDGQHGTQSC
jgi:hypothetical protein